MNLEAKDDRSWVHAIRDILSFIDRRSLCHLRCMIYHPPGEYAEFVFVTPWGEVFNMPAPETIIPTARECHVIAKTLDEILPGVYREFGTRVGDYRAKKPRFSPSNQNTYEVCMQLMSSTVGWCELARESCLRRVRDRRGRPRYDLESHCRFILGSRACDWWMRAPFLARVISGPIPRNNVWDRTLTAIYTTAWLRTAILKGWTRPCTLYEN